MKLEERKGEKEKEKEGEKEKKKEEEEEKEEKEEGEGEKEEKQDWGGVGEWEQSLGEFTASGSAETFPGFHQKTRGFLKMMELDSVTHTTPKAKD